MFSPNENKVGIDAYFLNMVKNIPNQQLTANSKNFSNIIRNQISLPSMNNFYLMTRVLMHKIVQGAGPSQPRLTPEGCPEGH